MATSPAFATSEAVASLLSSPNVSPNIGAALSTDVNSFIEVSQNASELLKKISSELKAIITGKDKTLVELWTVIYNEHRELLEAYKKQSSVTAAIITSFQSAIASAVDESKSEKLKLVVLQGIEKNVPQITDEVKKVYDKAQSLSDRIYEFSKKIDEAVQAEDADEDLIEVASLVVDTRVVFHELQKKIYSIGSGVGPSILHNNTTNGLWLNYLATILAAIYSYGRDSPIWTQFVKELYIDKYKAQDTHFRTGAFRQGKRYIATPSPPGEPKKIAKGDEPKVPTVQVIATNGWPPRPPTPPTGWPPKPPVPPSSAAAENTTKGWEWPPRPPTPPGWPPRPPTPPPRPDPPTLSSTEPTPEQPTPKYIWNELVDDANKVIAWVQDGSKAEKTPIVVHIYKKTQSTVYDHIADSLRTFVSRG